MPTDLERLVVQLDADLAKFNNAMNRATSQSQRQFRAIERQAMSLDARLSGIGTDAFKGLAAPIAGVTAALSTGEVLKYADAWTSAKNSLAVAGVTGQKQVSVLDKLFKSAQDNATPIGALTDLYGKASQASDELGASTQDLLKFSDGVAVALRVAGASAESASGALTQLGQLLASGTVHAEEFNSVNDGARPILQAVAAGLDKAGGSVSKLKNLVNDGQVSSKEFFDAFLRGLPAIQSMAANSTETIAQGITKIQNAMTKYIGETDSSLGASQRLVAGLNALADNFDETADVTLKLAAVIAGALVGRSLVAMVAKLVETGFAIKNFIALMRAARVATSFEALGSAAGPIGAILGIAAAAVALFASNSGDASRGAEIYAEALKKVQAAADGATDSIDKLNKKRNERQTNDASLGLAAAQDETKKAADAIVKYLDDIQQNAPRRLISATQLNQLAQLEKGFKDGTVSADQLDETIAGLANKNPKFQKMADQLKPLIDAFDAAQKVAKGFNDELAKSAAPTFTAPGYVVGNRVEQDTNTKRDAFLNQRDADSMKTDLQKNIDTRAKAISDAAAKLGVVLTDAAAKIQAQSEIAAENLAKTTSAGMNSAADLIKGFESFRSTPYMDRTHLRVGYGSDTITLSDGSVKEVTQGISVSVADANRDLMRRITETQSGIRSKIGDQAFNSLNEQQQAALTSIAYNYGTLPDRIVKAIQTGDTATIYNAIKGLGADNGGINQGRRDQEAQMFLTGAPTAVTNRVQATDDFAKTMKEQQAEIAALKAETGIRQSLNPLVKDYGKQLSEVEKAQELLKAAQQEGTAAGKELTDVQQLLNGDLSKLSPEAQKQALAMRALAVEYGNVSAASAKLKESQEQAAQASADQLQLAKDVTGGVLSDMRSALEDGKITWKEWGDIAVNALNKIADHVQDALLDQLFKPGFNLFGLLGGGTASGSSAGGAGFATGGYTGPGGKYQPAGIVHKGEFVFDQEAVKHIGVGNLKRLQGYANGGLVGMPSLPAIPSMSGGGRDSVHVTVGFAQDGLNLKPEVVNVATNVASRVGKAGLEEYRKGKFHSDWERHAGNRKVKGVSS